MDDETKEVLKAVIKALFAMAKERIKLELNPKNLIEDYLHQDKNS